MNKIFTLYSSSRRDGNTFNMVQTFNSLLPNEIWYLDDLDVQQYDYNHQQQTDDFERVIDRILQADIIILASPVYWYSMTPAFKRLFDRFTDLIELPHLKSKGKELRDRQFFLFLTSVNNRPPRSFIETVKETFNYLGWQYHGVQHIKCDGAIDIQTTTKKLSRFKVKLSNETPFSFAKTHGKQSRLLSRFK